MSISTKDYYRLSKREGERDEEGNLTPVAMAISALIDHGCDCGGGVDEPLCLVCICEAALISLLPKEE